MKSVYEILNITCKAVEEANNKNYGMKVDELLEIQERREFKFNPGIGDAIIDAYHLGLVRGMQFQANKMKN